MHLAVSKHNTCELILVQKYFCECVRYFQQIGVHNVIYHSIKKQCCYFLCSCFANCLCNFVSCVQGGPNLTLQAYFYEIFKVIILEQKELQKTSFANFMQKYRQVLTLSQVKIYTAGFSYRYIDRKHIGIGTADAIHNRYAYALPFSSYSPLNAV